MSFGPTFLAILSENHLSQADVTRIIEGEGIGITRSAVAQWVSGRTAPRGNILGMLLRKVCQTEEQRSRLLASMEVTTPESAAV